MKLYKKHDWNKKYLIENIEEIKGSTRVINTTLKKKKKKNPLFMQSNQQNL